MIQIMSLLMSASLKIVFEKDEHIFDSQAIKSWLNWIILTSAADKISEKIIFY